MLTTYLDRTVAELVRINPRRARVFERFGIDYLHGANIPLIRACQEVGVDIGRVCEELDECDSLVIFSHEVDWNRSPQCGVAAADGKKTTVRPAQARPSPTPVQRLNRARGCRTSPATGTCCDD